MAAEHEKEPDASHVSIAADTSQERTVDEALLEEEDGHVSFKTKLAVFSLIWVYESFQFTLTMPAAVLTYINAERGPDPRYPWIAICWNVGAAIIVTVGGRLSDITGRRWFLLVGALSAAVGCLLGATGQSINQMIAAGAVMGFGGGFQELCFACVQELVPNKYRFKVLGYMIFANHFSGMAPLLSYVFIQYSSIGWRTVYWWGFAWEIAAAVMLWFFYHPPTFETKHKSDKQSKMEILKSIDYVGLVLFTAGLLLILLGLNWGSQYSWSSAQVIAPIIVGFVCLVALGFWEVYARLKYPILPPHLFAQWRKFTSFLVVCFVAGMLYYSMNVIWPRQSGLLWAPADQPVIRGVFSSMVAYGVILGSWYTLFLLPRIRHEKYQLIGFMIIVTCLIGSLASVGIDDKAQAIATVILATAFNLQLSPLSFGMVSLHLEDQTDIGVAVGLTNTFRLMGGAISTAIYTSLQSSRFVEVLPSYVEAAAKKSGFDGTLSDLVQAAEKNTAAAYQVIPSISNSTVALVQEAVKLANSNGYQRVYLVAIAFGALAIIAACSTADIDDKVRSNNTAAHLENEERRHPTQLVKDKESAD